MSCTIDRDVIGSAMSINLGLMVDTEYSKIVLVCTRGCVGGNAGAYVADS